MNLKDRKIDLIYDVIDNLMALDQHEAIDVLMKCIYESDAFIDIDLAILTATLPIKYSTKIVDTRQKFLKRVLSYDKELIVGLT